jgi:transposase-like protein
MSVNVRSEEVTPKQRMLITAMLSGKSIVDAAKEAGIAAKTAHQWLKLAQVQAAYRDAQHALFDDAIRLFMTDMNDARITLRTLMKDIETPAATRVRAAQLIIEQSINLNKMSELEQKLAELEEIVQERHK